MISFSLPSRFAAIAAVVATLFIALTPKVSHADSLKFTVNFSDVSSLGSNYSLFADLSDTTGNFNSTNLTFTNFSGQSGAIAPFTLSDTSNFNENSAAFTAGSNTAPSPFSFDIYANFTPDATNPDQLAVFFGNNTDSSLDTGNLFTINFNSSNPGQVQFSTFSNSNPNVPAPTISVVATPEPSTVALLVLGMLAVVGMQWRRRSNSGLVRACVAGA